MKRKKRLWLKIAPAVAAVFTLGLLTIAASSVSKGASAGGKQAVEDAVRKAAASYYAAEGVYPPDLDTIVNRYALQIDGKRYEVKYDIFAENLAPDVTVVEKPEGRKDQ